MLPPRSPGGSIHINNASRLLAALSDEQRVTFSNACNAAGFESVALVPVRTNGTILGVIHVADPCENAVSLETLEILEDAAILLAFALQRLEAEESLRRSEWRMRAILNTTPDYAWLKDREGRISGGQHRVVPVLRS